MMLKEFFDKEKIEYFAELSIEDVSVYDMPKFEKIQARLGKVESILFFLIPYYQGQRTTNLSIYAQGRDYHGYVKELSQRLETYLKEKGADLKFMMFADTSPLSERTCAFSAGLGVLGKNGLLINEKYGSFVFIGSIFLQKAISPKKKKETEPCLLCGACEKACPTGAILDQERKMCLSLITQKKVLTEEEETLLKNAECKWGCDLCQNSCPLNIRAEKTPIPFFLEEQVSHLTREEIEAPKEEFEKRAYSWRGRKILYRNLEIEE